MRILLFVLAVLFVGLAAVGSFCVDVVADGPDPVAERRARAVESGDALRGMYFFRGGRGIHALPMITRAFTPGRASVSMGVEHQLRYRMGFQFDGCRPIGLANIPYRGVASPVVGCMACHTGRAAGRTVVGLANKTIDVGAIGDQMHALAGLSRTVSAGPTERELEASALEFADLLVDRRWKNPTQGLVPDFLIVHWFHKVTGAPLPEHPEPFLVKIPHLWGFPEKRPAGQFCDGFGRGLGWFAMQEVTAGQTPETVRAYADELERFARLTGDLLPPRFPFPVDSELAARGAELFADTCVRCHGDYERDALGFPIFRAPEMTSQGEVGTDPLRLALPGAAHRALVDASPLADMLAMEIDSPGYLAPRLDGIWARFPYLHNASVPTLMDLLIAPDQRPRVWSLQDAGEARRFDRDRVGLTLPRGRASRGLLWRARRGERPVYWVERSGHSNRGHDFGTELAPSEKRALLEYLKTL